ncbi:MAG: hypothetical protein FJ280_03360 [Planctomycetes bacterium]|nr:hypothetical protein [Planctomycetota bacterium]
MLGNEEERGYGEHGYVREWRTGWRRISWGSIFAGTLVTLAVFLTLQMLGAGIGAATIDLTGRETTSPRALGIGAAIWWLITGLIALFIGGWVAGRLAWLPSKLDRALHGLTVWGLFYVIMFLVATTALSALVGGGIALLGSGVSAAGQAAGSGQGQGVIEQTLQSIGLSPEIIRQEIAKAVGGGRQADDSLLADINEYLQGPRTPQDRQQLAQEIAQSTGMSQAQANQTITNLENAAQQARETGEQVATVTAATFISLAVAMILGAVAAALGGLLATKPPTPPYERRYDTGVRAPAETYASAER